ncbi:hypothetical protein [Rhizosaccharibacter radicis]|uniref:AsnC family protein n=1 Tax=Rhizosaccharibacter radicis TaxID=2782605 RepID=A0ABT1VW16_9PROT|nr:hypothetical protein [Acetobacteraceae bacterium KSS12]
MPRPLDWPRARDAEMLRLLRRPGATLRTVAGVMGVSRCFAQRRTVVLCLRGPEMECASNRAEAGETPLPPGHPISMGAIMVPSQIAPAW